MRLVFIATGDIALPAFRYLLDTGPRPLALVTQPDKPAGRHQTLTPPAVKLEALAAGIPVFQPETIGDIAGELSALAPEVIVVMAYGQMLWKNIRSVPTRAIINLHASLLPRHRGASCIQAAIDHGDSVTGITAMHVVRELDAGDVIFWKSIPIVPEETGGSLHDRLALLAPEVMAGALERLADGEAAGDPQDGALSNYAPKLGRDAGHLDWNLPATALERRIRAYDPWPGTFATLAEDGGGESRLKIFPPSVPGDLPLAPGEVSSAAGKFVIGCGAGSLELTFVQPPGGRRMAAADFLRGRKAGAFRVSSPPHLDA